jgi:hypothetical protein
LERPSAARYRIGVIFHIVQVALFKYDSATGTWIALTAGSGFECKDYASANVVAALDC